jgi:hypothetical protein
MYYGVESSRYGVYKGNRVDGQPHGHGTFTSAAGEEYCGEYNMGLRHGQGVLTLKSGVRYTGAFEFDKKCGFGTLATPYGRVLLQGPWADDKFQG